jgi:hypothetical protein
MSASPIDDEQFELFCEDADLKTPTVAAAALRRYNVPQAIVDALVERYENHVGEVMEYESPSYMRDGRIVTWYTGPRPSDVCWPALRQQLAEGTFKGDKDGLAELDRSSTRVLSLLHHPQTTEFRTKGLVIGYVQSGKTTNFTSVIAKAVDRGYRLVIVLAGIHNELRRQTQNRLVDQLIRTDPPSWLPLTTGDRDFHPPDNAPAYLARHTEQRVLCVVKKNAAVLRKLIEWLATAPDQLRDVPALIVDDEADQAAVATPTINPMVRELLGVLPKVAYVGYTATPFANLLIDPSADDLYPESFIVDLPKPAHHFGTETIFGRDPLDGEDPASYDDERIDVVRNVPVREISLVRPATRDAVDGFTPSVTGALREAVLWFWLATSARRVRGTGNRHSTMLVHTSVRVSVHESFRAPLDDLRDRLRDRLHESGVRSELRTLWENEAAKVPALDMGEQPVTFAEVLERLPEILDTSRVILDNSSSPERLDYSGDDVVAIAVGGNTLSRGLTLEGLVSSYFVRSASAYDTLLQMGRWFGFRNGYSDLARIWMTDDLRRYFRFIAGVEAEIRSEVARYMVESQTPRSLAVRIRAHDVLAITSGAKMANAVRASAAYGGLRIQTRFYRADDDAWLAQNERAAHQLVAAIGGNATITHKDPSSILWRSVDVSHVLGFLDTYKVHEIDLDKQSRLLRAYIEGRNKSRFLLNWNVAIVGSTTADRGNHDFGSGVEMSRVIRARLSDSPSEEAQVAGEADIKTLMSIRDAIIDVDVPAGERITEPTIKALRWEQLPDTALLVLYPIDAVSLPKPPPKNRRQLRTALGATRDAIGIGILFPQPVGDDEPVYWQADLSKVVTYDGYLEDEDVSPLWELEE